MVVTHAHYDHIGNLDLFPGSALITSPPRSTTSGPGRTRPGRWCTTPVEDKEIDHLRQAARDDRLRTFDDGVSPAPGIRVIPVGGHTPGQSVVLVNTSEGAVLLASDSVHYYEEYEQNMPFTQVANLIDMYAGFDRIRAMRADHLRRRPRPRHARPVHPL